MPPLRRVRTVAPTAAVAMVLLGASLFGSPALAKCTKDCRKLIAGDFVMCKHGCPKHKPGRPCRQACLSQKKADKLACKALANPTPPECGQTVTTTTMAGVSTTTTAVSATTTTTGAAGVVVGSLPATPGRFNFNVTLGLAGATAACNTSFAGAHACTLSELHNTPAGTLMGLKDTSNMTVMSFWAIDPAADPITAQCCDDVSFHPCTSAHNWEYGTAHTTSRGQKVALDNATGALGTLTTGVQCNFAPNNWVACCK